MRAKETKKEKRWTPLPAGEKGGVAKRQSGGAAAESEVSERVGRVRDEFRRGRGGRGERFGACVDVNNHIVLSADIKHIA